MHVYDYIHKHDVSTALENELIYRTFPAIAKKTREINFVTSG